VCIENRTAVEVMAQHDGLDTLHYLDPPYVTSTRSDPSKDYAFEMSDGDHAALATALKGLKGMVVLSGYRSPLYDGLYQHWRRFDKTALADGAAKRIESVWLNPRATATMRFQTFNFSQGVAS
jgi:DNA adenine methylase